ncbi:MAG: hypothetical protein GF320_06150 [Armatimonadia bacterium]|nr:hypothetical protein [Armatimonadia bacterium]
MIGLKARRMGGDGVYSGDLLRHVDLSRPRVLMPNAEVAYLRAHYNDDGVHVGFWNKVVARADLEGTWDQVSEADSNSAVQAAGDRCIAACYYAMAIGDTDPTTHQVIEAKVFGYVDNVAGWPHTSGKAVYSSDWAPRATLTALAAALDVFDGELDGTRRDALLSAIIARGETLYTVDGTYDAIERLRFFGEPKGSDENYWWSRAYENVYALGYAACAIWGEGSVATAAATRWVQFIVARLWGMAGGQPWSMYGEPKTGGFSDGWNYQVYRDFTMGCVGAVRALAGMGVVDWSQRCEYLEEAPRYLTYTNSPWGRMDHGGDVSAVLSGWGDLTNLTFNDLPGWRWAAFSADAATIWWAKHRYRRAGWPPGDAGTYASGDWPWQDHALSIHWYAADLDSLSAAPTDAAMRYRYFSDIDVVAMSDAYTDADRSLVVGFKSARYPLAATGHAHGDDNSFQLAYGPDWIFPIVGRYSEVYQSGRSMLKNVILFGDPGTWAWQGYGGATEQEWALFGFSSRPDAHGQILSTSDQPAYGYAFGEAGSCYQSVAGCVWKRCVALVRTGTHALPYVVVADQASTTDSLAYQYLLHGLAETDPFTIDAVNFEVDWERSDGAGTRYSEVQCHLRMLFPAGQSGPAEITSTQWTEWAPSWTNLRAWRLVTAFPASTSLVMAAVIVPYRHGDTPSPPGWTYGISGAGPYVVTVDDGTTGEDRITVDFDGHAVVVA